jgi:hypothetical protein
MPLYQPVLRPDQIRTLYCLKLREKRPMTRLLHEPRTEEAVSTLQVASPARANS